MFFLIYTGIVQLAWGSVPRKDGTLRRDEV